MLIPREINICNRNEVPQSVVEQIARLNPTFDLNVFDDKKCLGFLEQHFGHQYSKCFSRIPDGPIRADFWRICIVYERGGFYFDADVEHLLGIEAYLRKDASFMTSTSWHENMVNPIILASVPKNEILGRCIDRYIDMFVNKSPYSFWGWSICHIMHSVFKESGIDIKNDIKEATSFEGELYQFANEDKSSWNRDLFSTNYAGTKILMNHRKDYCSNERRFV